MNGKEVLEFKNTNSFKHLSLPAHEKRWHVAELFQKRLNSLNNLVKRRESLIHKVPVIEGFNDSSKEYDLNHGQKEDDVDSNQCEKFGYPHSLSERDPDLPLTDASKRLSLRFEDFQDEAKVSKGISRRVQNQGSKRTLVNGCEKRNIEKQLESNSSKYLSRAANSLRFQVRKVQDEGRSADSQQMTEREDYPIPLGGFEMNPHLLLKLSCEKMAVDRGRGLMKLVSSNSISLDLYVYMYWFIHCRFFQKYSSSEQRYLLGKVSSIFPRFIELLTTMAPPKQRDTVFRHYPFVLSKAIYLGLQYLCPGNKSLFKGPFLRILYLSVFRLLTGVDICPESVDAIRFKLYPDDALIEDSNDEEKKEGDCRLQEGHYQDYRRRSRSCGLDNLSKCKKGRHINEKVKSENVNNEQNEMISSTDDLKPAGHKLSKSYNRNLAKSKLTSRSKSLPLRQQQVNFDVNQISPLLQQCLGRECISLRPKQFIKRIEPVRKSSIQTDDDDDGDSVGMGHIRYNTDRFHDDCNDSNHDNGNSIEDLMQRHADLKREMKTALLQNELECQNAMSIVAKEKANALKSKEAKEEMVSKIMIQMGRSQGRENVTNNKNNIDSMCMP